MGRSWCTLSGKLKCVHNFGHKFHKKVCTWKIRCICQYDIKMDIGEVWRVLPLFQHIVQVFEKCDVIRGQMRHKQLIQKDLDLRSYFLCFRSEHVCVSLLLLGVTWCSSGALLVIHSGERCVACQCTYSKHLQIVTVLFAVTCKYPEVCSANRWSGRWLEGVMKWTLGVGVVSEATRD